MKHDAAWLKDIIDRNNGRIRLDGRLREKFESFAALEITPEQKPAFALVQAQLKTIETKNGTEYTRSMLDNLAEQSLDRAGAFPKKSFTQTERLAFRCFVQENFSEALAVLGRYEEAISLPPAPPNARTITHVPPTRRAQQRMGQGHYRDSRPLPGHKPLPPRSEPKELTGLIPNYVGPNDIKKALIAFRYPDDATRDKFFYLFNNGTDQFPFAGARGRIVGETGAHYAAICAHYDSNGICYLGIPNKVTRSGEYLSEVTDPEIIENARQAALHILGNARLVPIEMSLQAGYKALSEGACYVHQQLFDMGAFKGKREL